MKIRKFSLIHRDKGNRKGENGRVLVIAGSKDYTGSAFLAAAAIACLRSGTDLVTLACPEKVAWAVNAMSPDIITSKLKGDYLSLSNLPQIKKLADKSDVILIGPGISRKKETVTLVKRLVKIKKPKVIDADALKMLKLQDVNNAILTPHSKEFEILLKNSKLTAKNFMKKIRKNVILHKAPIDEIYSSERVIFVSGGNSGMAVGGTGDVLAGLCAGFVAQGYNLLDSAHMASKMNKKIGDNLKKRIGYGFIASDFLAEIPKMRDSLEREN